MNSAQIITAMEMLSEQIEPQSPKDKGAFGQTVKIASGNVTINNSTLDVKFTIPFDDGTEANEAEITVYNLSKTTRANLKYDAPISVTAGYSGDTGVIFSGHIGKVKTVHDGVDVKTTIYAIDDKSLKERDITSISYAAGTKASYILKSLLDMVGLPIAVFKVRYDYTYEDEVNVDGGIMAAIKKYASVCGVSCFINKGKLYAVDVTASPIDLQFTIGADTGMIGHPEEFEEEIREENYTETIKGYSVKMLLQHRMTCGAVCNIQAKDVTGKFYVREGTHTCNGRDFLTEIKMIAR